MSQLPGNQLLRCLHPKCQRTFISSSGRTIHVQSSHPDLLEDGRSIPTQVSSDSSSQPRVAFDGSSSSSGINFGCAFPDVQGPSGAYPVAHIPSSPSTIRSGGHALDIRSPSGSYHYPFAYNPSSPPSINSAFLPVNVQDSAHKTLGEPNVALTSPVTSPSHVHDMHSVSHFPELPDAESVLVHPTSSSPTCSGDTPPASPPLYQDGNRMDVNIERTLPSRRREAPGQVIRTYHPNLNGTTHLPSVSYNNCDL